MDSCSRTCLTLSNIRDNSRIFRIIIAISIDETRVISAKSASLSQGQHRSLYCYYSVSRVYVLVEDGILYSRLFHRYSLPIGGSDYRVVTIRGSPPPHRYKCIHPPYTPPLYTPLIHTPYTHPLYTPIIHPHYTPPLYTPLYMSISRQGTRIMYGRYA